MLWLFRGDLSTRMRWGLLAVNAAVVGSAPRGDGRRRPFERAAREAVYGERRAGRRADRRPRGRADRRLGPAAYERGAHPLQFFLDGQLRVDSADGNRYHAALVRPAMATVRVGAS